MPSLYLIIVLSVAWLVLCAVMWRLHRSRLYSTPELNTSILITYASQTGNAQAIAKHCAVALNLSENSNVIALNTLTFEHLSSIDKVLFVVSTYGDGESPDNGSLFTNLATVLSKKSLDHLKYSVIALGDSTYPKFCAFGYQINQTMLNTGAQLLGEVITVDNYDEQTTELIDITPGWIKSNLVEVSAVSADIVAVKSPQYWQLTQRKLLNPSCNDEKLFQLSFNSVGPAPTWRAGDLIDIQPQYHAGTVESWLLKNQLDGNAWLTYQGHHQRLKTWLLTRDLPMSCSWTYDELLNKLPFLPKRTYSVASVPQMGTLQLIVRLFEKNDVNNSAQRSVDKKGQSGVVFGLASGYLTQACQIGNIVEGHIRHANSHYNIAQNKPVILIGAGSGLAGLQAQIIERSMAKPQSAGASWLIYGERNSNPVLPINKQLAALEKTQLTKLSYAFSQDANYPKYVQNILLNEQSALKQWLDDGAVIYVCGSLSGMGEGVHQTLIELFGQSTLDTLQLQQRYIRDVY